MQLQRLQVPEGAMLNIKSASFEDASNSVTSKDVIEGSNVCSVNGVSKISCYEPEKC
jgi:hypothetical protein